MFLQACVRCRWRSFSFFLSCSSCSFVFCAEGVRACLCVCLRASEGARSRRYFVPSRIHSAFHIALGFLLIFVSSEFTVAPRPAHVFLELCRGEGESYNFLLAFIDAWPFESCAL